MIEPEDQKTAQSGASEKDKRASLRLKNPKLKAAYMELAALDKRSFNEMAELAMEIALPALRQRVALMRQGFLNPMAA